MFQTHSECPRCGTQAVRLTRARNPWDRLFTMVSCYPFRCQLCKERFHAIRPRYGFQARHADWREYERIPVEFRTVFSGEQIRGEGTMADVSVNGCWIASGLRVAKGTALHLHIYSGAQEPPIELAAVVARCTATKGFGLAFSPVRPEQQERLRQVIASRSPLAQGHAIAAQSSPSSA